MRRTIVTNQQDTKKTHKLIFLPLFRWEVELDALLSLSGWRTKNHTERSCHSIAIHGTTATPFSQQREKDVDNNLERNLEEITLFYSQNMTKMLQKKRHHKFTWKPFRTICTSSATRARATEFPVRWLANNTCEQTWTSGHFKERSVDQKIAVKVTEAY